MQAAVVPAVSSSWQVKEVPQPQPGPNQVLMKMIFGPTVRTGWQRYLYLSAINRFLRDSPSVDVHIVTQEPR